MAVVREFRKLAHRTRRDAEMGGLRDERDGGIEQRHQSHTRRTEQQSHKLIAYKAHQHIESLYAPEDTCVLQHVAVGSLFAFVHSIYITQRTPILLYKLALFRV